MRSIYDEIKDGRLISNTSKWFMNNKINNKSYIIGKDPWIIQSIVDFYYLLTADLNVRSMSDKINYRFLLKIYI